MTELTNYNNEALIENLMSRGGESAVFNTDRLCSDTLWRSHSAAMAMLRYAMEMIGRSETRIAEQQERIKQLEALAITDELTGLLNRRGFYAEMAREMARLNRRRGASGLLLLVDMDGFKQINDTYGHAAGDACLRLVADNLVGCVRREDAAGRLGGDEFAVLLSGADADKGPVLARRIASRINRLKLRWGHEEIALNASVGVRVFDAQDRIEGVFSDADDLLYDDKRSRVKALEHVA